MTKLIRYFLGLMFLPVVGIVSLVFMAWMAGELTIKKNITAVFLETDEEEVIGI